MKQINIIISIIFIGALISGCATGLNNSQHNELREWQAKGLAVEEKSPGAAAGLGLLPGVGSFYTRSYGLGVVNLLFWPLSMCWDPVSGHNGAQSINYFATKADVSKKMEKELRQLDMELEDESITEKQYILRKRKIESKFRADI